ncbi:TetR/AcrR family transcriptional regulator [Halegenticoccus soli]|uniref:TetR/AcrR family transcriptional regulator n=1 Tax=Halegenticoccus soli TaxID=1985678 RepID=UPI000C6E6211|nr:TetR/AcrR family transcriptional regulator [Halegenticoccus soli]
MSEDTTEEIMGATYCALCKHGYAALTMQNIADESGLSKAALHYHYDSKRDLLLAFLDYLLDRFRERIDAADADDPAERLAAFVDVVFTPRREDTHREFKTAVLEIKAQAPYDDGFRERLAEFDRLMHDRVRSIVADGIERGVFRGDADPDDVASFVITVMNGANARYVAVGAPVGDARRTLMAYLETQLFADGRDPEVAAE